MRTDTRTFTDDRADLRWGTLSLGVLLAIPLAGLFGLPLLILLLCLFLLNPAGLGTYLGQQRFLQYFPGFRTGRRVHMAIATLLYLLPLTLLGMLVVSVDSILVLGFRLARTKIA